MTQHKNTIQDYKVMGLTPFKSSAVAVAARREEAGLAAGGAVVAWGLGVALATLGHACYYVASGVPETIVADAVVYGAIMSLAIMAGGTVIARRHLRGWRRDR